MDASKIGSVVAPGDTLFEIPESGTIRIGQGVFQDGDNVACSRAGIVQQTKQGKVWVDGSQRRYIPQEDDLVIGVVRNKAGDNYSVEINAPFPALLNVLAFENATRRNRPNLEIGDVVYARVSSANRDMDPELVCVDSAGRAAGYGQLKEGCLYSCSTGLCRRLLSRPPSPLLTALGEQLKFEIAVGLNGRFWVNAEDPLTVTVVSNAILASELLSDDQAVMLARTAVERVRS